ncbi:phosphoribosyl-ATP diphosphatase [Ornithobacterium rhinotracheale]|uniref:phosphoribosyl-ATP diphosphatase n=1 Tax=Ornithobacterium rhinotracheale TaxID=28251 RepID=UPI00129C2A0B|nr:phosphoribosyl-ATP diphosphatase [Ornithobacterium rhinotracheale]MRI63569.1 phosphoribosyl-ATP diphosphatase [Ornithobacterium rhinotracheale]MRJ11604.1 phosphoribosyl-ATP diphosphatase [Ornithobacterium rhinotracheale]
MPKEFPFLKKFERKIEEAKSQDKNNRLARKLSLGPYQLAKKMGEESVEMVIASGKECDKDFLEEAADVFYYYMLALHDRGYSLKDVLLILKDRDKNGKKNKVY